MTATSPSLLIAEQDDTARLFLADNLGADDYRPTCADDPRVTMKLLAGPVDALIVDLNGDTLRIVDAIRQETVRGVDPQLPILALTSHVSELHRTRLLERGADDVLCKPYSYPELRARLASLLRRARARQAPRILRAGALRLDLHARRVWIGDIEIAGLRAKEYELLIAMIREPERVFTRQELIRSVWGFSSPARTRTVDSHAARLRAHLGAGGSKFVHNVWGVGYRLVDPITSDPGDSLR